MAMERAPFLSVRFRVCTIALACSGLVTASAASPAKAASSPTLLDGMDRSVVPGDDFYDFANGDWLSTYEIPAVRASYGTEALLAELNQQRIADLIRQTAASHPPENFETRKIADYCLGMPDRDYYLQDSPQITHDQDTWRAYLTFHELSRYAPFLPKSFVSEQFNFYGTVLNGTPLDRERWKRAVDCTDDALGEAVGKLYVQRYFPPEAKARVESVVRNLIAAFATSIDQLSWMTAPTKIKAKAKLATLKVSVGYPDHWRDYAALDVRPDDALGNRQRAELFAYRNNLEKLKESVDRSEWVMLPQEVDAVNLPAMNAINFPAAILQPAALNYGAIRAVIGHEISHSFDDQGALFDATGRLRNWWTDADFAHFRASAQQLVEQFNGYRPFVDLAVNGQQTLSENIADVAGLAAAYAAYHLSLHGQPASALQGFNGDQQFFLAFAQIWRKKSRDARERQLIVTNGHAPARYRGQTVRNIDAWYGAFDVRPGQKLYLSPAQRVRIW